MTNMTDYRDKVGKSGVSEAVNNRQVIAAGDTSRIQTGADADSDSDGSPNIQIDYYKLLDIMVTGAASGLASAMAIKTLLGDE